MDVNGVVLCVAAPLCTSSSFKYFCFSFYSSLEWSVSLMSVSLYHYTSHTEYIKLKMVAMNFKDIKRPLLATMFTCLLPSYDVLSFAILLPPPATVSIPATIVSSSVPTSVAGHMMYQSPHTVMYTSTPGLADGGLAVLNAFSQGTSAMQVSHAQAQDPGRLNVPCYLGGRFISHKRKGF